MSDDGESDSDVEVRDEWENSDDSHDEFIAPLTAPTRTAGEAAGNFSKLVKMWTIDNAAQFLSPAGRRETFDFGLQHPAYPKVAWGVSLHPPKDGELVPIPCNSLFAHFVQFPVPRPGPPNAPCRGHCLTSVTAELMLLGDDGPIEDKDFVEGGDVIGVVKTGRNSMDARKATYLTRQAWPLSVLQTAAAKDGSLHIRLTLEIDFEIERAIRSRDLLQGLLKSGLGSDFTIRVGDEQFAVHKAVLSKASSDLNNLLTSMEKENMLDLTEVVSAAGVNAFLALIYLDASYEWIAQSDVAVVVSDVLLLADRFKTHQFMDQIGALVQKCVCMDNVLRILEVACNQDAPTIEAICFDCIFANRVGAQTPEFLAKLQQFITNDKARSAVIHAIFNRRCCSASCRCGRRRLLHELDEIDDTAESLPNEPILFARTLEISKARLRLRERRELRYELGRSALELDHALLFPSSSEGFEWKVALQPGSDLPNKRHTSFAAISVWLESVPASHLSPLGDLKGCGSYWAYVDLCLESGGACRNEKWRYEYGVPFEFIPAGRRVFFVAEAWSMAALHEAIRDDTLRIKVELRLVKLPQFLRCHEIMLRAQEADRAVEGSELITAGDATKSGSDCLKSVQTWIIGDASHGIATEKCIDLDFHVAHPAFPGVRLGAVLLPRVERPWRGDYSSLHFYAKFHNFSAHCVSRCCVGITAELVKLPRKALDGSSQQQELFKIVEIGPMEMIGRPGQYTFAVAEVWPFQVLKSAISPEDDTLRVRFTLTIFNIEQAFGMHASIRELHRSGRSSDFTITAGGETFVVHKCVLSAISSKRRASISDDSQGGVLDLTGVASAAGVEAFLALAYCDTFDWLAQDDVTGVVCDVLALADQFGAEQIKDQIVPAIAKILSPESVLRIFDAAIKFDASKAKDACFHFLLRNGIAVQHDELMFAQLQGHAYLLPGKSELQPQRKFSPDADTIFVSSKKASGKRSRSVTPISDDDTRNFNDKSSFEAKNMYLAECDLKKALRVDNYYLHAAFRIIEELERKIASGQITAGVLLRMPTILETLKKCRKFSVTPEIPAAAKGCVDLMKSLFDFAASSTDDAQSDSTMSKDEKWFKNFKRESEKYWRENKEWANHIRQYILEETLRAKPQPEPMSTEQSYHDYSSQLSTEENFTAASNRPTISATMDVAEGSTISPAVSGADEKAAKDTGPQEPRLSSAAGFDAPLPITAMNCTGHTEVRESAPSMEIAADTSEAVATQRQSGAADLLQEKENAEKERRILGDFLLAFFQRQLCCGRACDLPAAPRSTQLQTACSMELQRIEGRTICPMDDVGVFSLQWTIESASEIETLHQPMFLLKSSVHVDKPPAVFTFRMKLHPKGDSLSAQHDEFASFALCVAIKWPSAQSERPDSFWAAIELNLVAEGGGVVSGSNLLVPFRFTKNSRKLTLDKAWPSANLRKAIWRSDDTLHIGVKLTMVNIPSVLNCFDLIRGIYEKRAFTDFVLGCKGETVKVHKSVLAQRSEIFATMFSSDMREATENYLDLTDSTTPSGLTAFVDTIYFGEVNCCDGETTMELVKLAHRYEVNDVKSACDQQLALLVDMENVLEILAACDLYSLPVSKVACMRYFGANCLDFLKSPRWRELIVQGNIDLLQTLAKEGILNLGSSFKNQQGTVRR